MSLLLPKLKIDVYKTKLGRTYLTFQRNVTGLRAITRDLKLLIHQ